MRHVAYQKVIKGLHFLILPLSWAIVANCVHLSTIVYGVPTEYFTILTPILAGIHIGYSTSLRKSLLSSVAFLFLLATFIFVTLDLPVFLGILDESYVPIFEFFNMLKVLRSMIVFSFFTIISEIGVFLFKNL